MDIVSFTYGPRDAGRLYPAFSEIGGRYEGNPWLRPTPTRYVGTIEVAWEGDMPQELRDLLERMDRG